MKSPCSRMPHAPAGLPVRALILAVSAALILVACAEANAPVTEGDACTAGVLCYQDAPSDVGLDTGGGHDSGICTTNPCGGCVQLMGRPGDSCGECGQYACDGLDSLLCDEGTGNACSGCVALPQQPGDVCESCGEVVCDGIDAVRCDNSGVVNSCGGCDVLEGVKRDVWRVWHRNMGVSGTRSGALRRRHQERMRGMHCFARQSRRPLWVWWRAVSVRRKGGPDVSGRRQHQRVWWVCTLGRRHRRPLRFVHDWRAGVQRRRLRAGV